MESRYRLNVDEEKQRPVDTVDSNPTGDNFPGDDSTLAKLQRFARRHRIEQKGIERVSEDERTDKSLATMGTMWLAANMNISTFALGTLGVTVFELGFIDGFLTILFINLLGITSVAFFSTFGPRYGLRQMILSRYFFGFYGVKLVAIFNVMACLGWSAVNAIVGAQLLIAVNSKIPGYGGIIIIAAGALMITVFGYKVVHIYAKWSWIPSFVVFMIVLGQFAHSGAFNNLPMHSGKAQAGPVLGFAAAVFGFATGWTSLAADYGVYQPSTVSPVKAFAFTYGGLIFPLLLTEFLGLAIATACVPASTDVFHNPYFDSYQESGVGGLLGAVLLPPFGRFGEFCLVVLALSMVANNCPNMYSLTFSLQVLGRWTQAVPRFIWSIIGTFAYCAIAIPGYSKFEVVLQEFMLFIGYWLAIYEGVALTEHFVFARRRSPPYDISIYATPNRLPPGIAAVAASCVGVVGAAMGMAQTWLIGPVGKLIGTNGAGGDIGFPLAFGFAAVAYTGFRTVERRVFGR